MTNASMLALRALCAVLSGSMLCAADLSTYRGFQIGMNLSVAAKHAGVKPSEAKLIHQRPAVIQELNWRPPHFQGSFRTADSVAEGLLCFYNGQLFRMVITYDRYKVEGMTAEDMVEAISAIYGSASRPTVDITYRSHYAEAAPVIARWEDSGNSYNLVRTDDRSSFAVVLFSKRLNALAEESIVEAVRLDKQEAPQRELDAQAKQQEDIRLALEKARSINRPNFRP